MTQDNRSDRFGLASAKGLTYRKSKKNLTKRELPTTLTEHLNEDKYSNESSVENTPFRHKEIDTIEKEFFQLSKDQKKLIISSWPSFLSYSSRFIRINIDNIDALYRIYQLILNLR